MVEFNPKDMAILDRGLSTEEVVVIYMAGPTIVAVCSLTDGSDRFRVAKTRLTKCDAEGKPLT